MSRTIISSLAGVFVASALLAAQATPPPSQTTPPSSPPAAQATQPQDREVKITGCIVQGSGPTVFLLENAKMDEQSTTEKPKTYILASGAEDVGFSRNLNHKVTVSGSAESKTAPVPPAGQKVAEKDLPKLTAKSVLSVADTCGF